MLNGKNILSNIAKNKVSDEGIIASFNKTEEDIKVTTLHQMFIEQAKKTPDHVAVMLEDECITYQQLDEKSNQVANYLIKKGVKQNQLVGILADRVPDTIVNIFGILKAGAGYVPVDPSYPQERRDYIFSNSNCNIFLNPQTYIEESIGSLSTKLETMIDYKPEDLAYVIYTSGSTGRPKGVVITHGAAANTILDINRKFKVDENDRVIGISSICFDLSVYDIFGALGAGATLIQIPDQRDIFNIIDVLEKEAITIWNSVPAIIDMLVQNAGNDFKNDSLRLVLLSGDWIPLKLPMRIRETFGSVQVISLGGATEAAIWSIYYPIHKVDSQWKSIPYGTPLANQKFYILRYDQLSCPVGVMGEIYIGGTGLAKGYLNEEEKTKASFITHPQFGRLYRTGDYGMLRKEGYIEFLGRKDQQVKIRGYRIELGEIEKCLQDHVSVQNVVVTDRDDLDGKRCICAYIVPESALVPNEEYKAFLSKKLPDYMIPSYFLEIAEIPISANGKVDKKQLPDIQNMNDSEEKCYEASENDCQQKLVELCENILSGVQKIGISDNFFEMGVDSVSMVRLIADLNSEFGVQIPFKEFLKINNIRELSEYVLSHSEAACGMEEKKEEGNVIYYWSPIIQWKSKDNKIFVGSGIYSDILAGDFLEFYFAAQKGITVEQIKDKFVHFAPDRLDCFIRDMIEKKILVNSILTPEELFSSQTNLYQHDYGDTLLYSAEAYEEFKKKQLSRTLTYPSKDKYLLENTNDYPLSILNRRTCRTFNIKKSIPLNQFSKLLSVYRQRVVGGQKKYYYASAGGLYPIDVFVYVKKNRVEGISQGLYYYNPIENSLESVNDKDKITADAHYFTNKNIFNSSAFSIFYVYNVAVTMPRYAGNGYFFSFIDTGIMVSTMSQEAELLNMGVCSIGDMNYEKVRSYFGLSANQVFIHTVEVGLKLE